MTQEITQQTTQQEIIPPVALEGASVRLEPLANDHVEPLKNVVKDGELWKLFVTLVPQPEGIEQFVQAAQDTNLSGDGLVFATIDKASDTVVGSTRFMQADLPNHRIEIGFTFIAKSWQKTHINTEAKLLMFAHAFETLGLNRVELRTDYLNSNSRRAIMRLGAKEEGILRNHMVMPDGRVRDSAVYSVIRNEWPGVRQNLEYKLSSTEQV